VIVSVLRSLSPPIYFSNLGALHQLRRSYLFARAGLNGPGAKLVAQLQSKAGTSWFSPHVMHDAYCTFKVPALHAQVKRKESIALIYQNADLPGSSGRCRPGVVCIMRKSQLSCSWQRDLVEFSAK
jgi:hypothetical protein